MDKQEGERASSEPHLPLVKPFYMHNTVITSITNMSKNTLNKREKWLVLPTLYATQCRTVKIEAKNSVLSEQKPHHQAGKNDGDTANYGCQLAANPVLCVCLV